MAEESQENENKADEEQKNFSDINASNAPSHVMANADEPADNIEEKKENETSPENNIKPVPLFSEETADFLMHSKTVDEALHFIEGKEYSFPYLFKKFLLPVWDQYCDNFPLLILPVLFFSVLEAVPALILIYYKDNLLLTGLFILLILAPLHISRNLFFIKLLSGEEKPFLKSLSVFTSFRFYIQSVIIVSAFAACLFSGISLMVLPGYLFYVMFSLSLYFAADERLRIKPAFKLAFAASRGYRFFIGVIFVISAVFQTIIPGIFSVELADSSLNVSLVPQLWNIAGFSIFMLVLAPIINIINTGIYLESKVSVLNAVSRILNRAGAGDRIIIRMKNKMNEEEIELSSEKLQSIIKENDERNAAPDDIKQEKEDSFSEADSLSHESEKPESDSSESEDDKKNN
ncbi:MAG: hypothetical protein K5838_08705 [Elusimicrobiales bacterium]|nr:hypothetical protein [Elusimicrobiales bacterium]